ncbi:putative neprosin activation peptide [Medicago truncatula]|uniref:Putative neprosin activation peptide n=1 Tax=Medicago truncatula TaxID=3880 RepID=A0A396GH81_MEDTR|nr:putative neprosin activation peptide [Medicago truncatula]
MIIILLFCLCLAAKNYEVYGSMSNFSKIEDLELEEQLKAINKPPVKSIQTEFGRIVDCIDINKQLAFDHPLLKNHKIQLKFSFQDTQTNTKSHDRSGYSKIGLDDKDLCPKGTIPVQRTTKDDLIRAKRLSNNFGTLTKFDRGSHFAGIRIRGRIFFGVKGNLDVYNPPVDDHQMSSAYIYVSTGESSIPVPNHMFIHAGWQVFL